MNVPSAPNESSNEISFINLSSVLAGLQLLLLLLVPGLVAGGDSVYISHALTIWQLFYISLHVLWAPVKGAFLAIAQARELLCEAKQSCLEPGVSIRLGGNFSAKAHLTFRGIFKTGCPPTNNRALSCNPYLALEVSGTSSHLRTQNLGFNTLNKV